MAIIFGTPDLLKPTLDFIGDEQISILNFNSILEYGYHLKFINPYGSVGGQVFRDEYSFDVWYVNYITQTPDAFKEFIDMMRLVYNGISIYVICEWDNDISVNMIEAIIKFITDNYGCICNIVKSIPDLLNLKECTFSAEGVQMFDRNMDTYINLFGYKDLPNDVEYEA